MAKKRTNLSLSEIVAPLPAGIVKNNPVFRLVLGTCPTLAVTTSAINGLSMGLATTFVLIGANAIVSLLRNFIPQKVRIPCFILVIATFSTVVEMVMNYALPDLYETLGLFIPLIVVNCIVLARAESFASVNPVLPSMMDGLGIGLGFTVSLTFMGLFREFLGAGSVFGYAIPGLQDVAMTIFILPAGGFLAFGLLMVVYNQIFDAIDRKRAARRAALSVKKDSPEMQAAVELAERADEEGGVQ